MNKRIFGVILSLLLVLSCCSFVFAQGEDYMYYVTDQAGLLSEAEWISWRTKLMSCLKS